MKEYDNPKDKKGKKEKGKEEEEEEEEEYIKQELRKIKKMKKKNKVRGAEELRARRACVFTCALPCVRQGGVCVWVWLYVAPLGHVYV